MKRTAMTLRRRLFHHRLNHFHRMEERCVPAVLTFQQGFEGTTDGVLNGFVYNGMHDAEINSKAPTTNFDTGGPSDAFRFSIDSQDTNGLRQALLRFDSIFGPGVSQVPIGSTITKATVTVRVASSTDPSCELGFYRMRQPWFESSVNFNSFQPIGGVQTNGIEAEPIADFRLPDNKVANNITLDIDMTSAFAAWATGIPNYGWVIDQTGVNGWDIFSSELLDASNNPSPNRPKLTIEFTPPSGNGALRFTQSSYQFPEPDTGIQSHTLLVSRNGGLAGTVSVDYTIAAIGGSATGGVDFDTTVTTGTITFLPNETNKPVSIKLIGDTAIEGPEAFKITLSNPQGGASISAAEAIINIVDNDILLNEMVANHSGIADDGYEFVELTGAPDAVLPNKLFLVAFDSTTEDSIGLGTGIGSADFVVHLGGTTIGSNGLLVVTPTNFKYVVPAATTRIISTKLDEAGGGLSNRSVTFALVYSPNGDIIQGFDYDQSIGSYVDATTPFLNDGVLDMLPAGAVFLDSVGCNEGPNGDVDRSVCLVRPPVTANQPDGILDSGKQFTADGYSRFFGDRQASNLGSWYNGELNGVTTVYSTGLLSSVLTPPGGQVTPGDVNLPRGIGFAVTSINVNETAGTVTVFVNRTGDNTVATSIDFTTVDGSAKGGPGLDFTAVNGTLQFGIGVDVQPIVISINNDATPEGFESFFIQLSNPGAPFALVTQQAKVTIADDDATVTSFQDGDLIGEYTGTRDAGLYGWLAQDKIGSDLTMSIDRNDDDPTLSNDLEKPNQGLIRFENIFGSGPGQVPIGSTIHGGFITFHVISTSNVGTRISLHRMLADWSEATATFANPAVGVTNGVTTDDVEAVVTPDGFVSDAGQLGFVDAQLSIDSLQAWANGAANYGWLLQSDSTNGWDFDTADQIGPSLRPRLSIIYSAPGGAGSIRFDGSTYLANEDAGTASLMVQRVGATTGTTVVNWSITGGTASAADYTGPTSGTLTFSPTDLALPITIPLVNDGSLETNETLIVTLTGAGVNFTRNSATLVIRDNDFNTSNPAILLNEFHINPSGNDNPFEFAEVKGTANAGMGGLYIVSMQGDTSVFSGNADTVFELSQYANGTNGYTLVKGAVGGYPAPAGTTIVPRNSIDTADNFLNGSNSFLLIYSPQATIAEGFDFDWGNDGTLNLPTGAVVVDAVGYATPGSGGRIYGGAELVQDYTPQAISRYLNDANAKSAAAWFRGTISGSSDSLVYSSTNNTGLPISGAALTPGGANTSDTAPLTTATVSIDVGTAQRSMVRSLTVTFTNPVDYMGANAFSLTDNNGSAINGVSLNVVGLGTTTLTITFTGTPIIGGSLADGRYRLTIDGDNLYAAGRMIDGKNDGIPGSNGTTDFHRLFGDADGDSKVNSADFAVFRSVFGLSGTSIFDFAGDNQTNSADFAHFRSRFGLTLP